jgi:hypothetical protein
MNRGWEIRFPSLCFIFEDHLCCLQIHPQHELFTDISGLLAVLLTLVIFSVYEDILYDLKIK